MHIQELEDDLLDEETARVATIDAALDIEDQARAGGALVMVLAQARDEAISALNDLVQVETQDPTVRALQWKVTRYDDLCRFVRGILDAGRAAREDLSEDQQAALERQIRGGRSEPKDT